MIFLKPTAVDGLIDPVTGAFALGAFVAGYFFHKTKYSNPFSRSCPREMDIRGEDDSKIVLRPLLQAIIVYRSCYCVCIKLTMELCTRLLSQNVSRLLSS